MIGELFNNMADELFEPAKPEEQQIAKSTYNLVKTQLGLSMLTPS